MDSSPYADDNLEKQKMLPEIKGHETWHFSDSASTTIDLSDPEVESPKKLNFERIYSISLHLVVILLTMLLWLSRMESSAWNSSPSEERTWSPVLPYVEYEISGENALDHSKFSKYSGPPSLSLDQAWDDLVLPIHFRATQEELEQAGETWEDAVELDDGGYLATTGVYHELHCLRRLRWYLYKDDYYTNITSVQEDYLKGHLDHCLETLRMTIMCHGNSALYSFYWPNGKDPSEPLKKPVAKSNSKDVCVKWRSIEDWSYSRMVAPDHPLKMPRMIQQ
ncbi:hypothetical protein QBC38DRAFT_486307 [Podospora fimiseda]|uniref:Tat pathway signal sequence protein n=1 Tax=Podospora fimiseda TaxID=252190 RepID=A0AAN7BIV0_9PEZI|nr:hypothetical protein QBC38DRAFT_486307 [Podospora fimiseda]